MVHNGHSPFSHLFEFRVLNIVSMLSWDREIYTGVSLVGFRLLYASWWINGIHLIDLLTIYTSCSEFQEFAYLSIVIIINDIYFDLEEGSLVKG